jgi:hypothetical protein
MKRKENLLLENLESRKPFFRCDYTLRIEMVHHENGGLRPLTPVAVWRKVVVSGGITLRQLHDRVLGPAMGWVRNYHGYLIIDTKDGSQFSAQDTSAINMMFLFMHGHDYLSDLKVKLGELVQAPGETSMYEYDLGDRFLHRITVERIAEAESSSG